MEEFINLQSSKIRSEVKELLLRSLEGKELKREEAYQLAKCKHEELKALMLVASKIRDEQKGRVISYSKKVFLPLTNICRNKCSYCGFRRDPSDPDAEIMSLSKVIEVAEVGRKVGCKEALFSLGEKPEEAYPEVKEKLRKLGYRTTIEYLIHACGEVMNKTGLLPHVNPGILEKDEVRDLKEVSASMGLMLEIASDRLCEKGGPHEFSEGKKPKLRLKTMEYAGQLKVPFTTGLLIGIGETVEERVDTLFAIKELHERYGHIQEVIIQGFKPKPNTPMQNHPEPSLEDLLSIISVARLLFKGEMNVQSPPNLNPGCYQVLIQAGINDWGGISPVTKDFINPEYRWPCLSDLRKRTEEQGFILRERLPIYPEFVLKDGFMSELVKNIVISITDKDGWPVVSNSL